ncbi:hypothetical protein ABIA33_001404 [Streptacidiphilus sp. MAP12-16]|uniref:hypothetical protein n=1 Tax=Streptacidiphilus sp. MAP12-16 TaxID=3156300 RepID=UPI0035184FBE
MSESTPDAAHQHHALVVAHPVVDAIPPFRRVEILGVQVGKAYRLADVAEFCRQAGLEDLDLEAPGRVHWIGGGSHAREAE